MLKRPEVRELEEIFLAPGANELDRLDERWKIEFFKALSLD